MMLRWFRRRPAELVCIEFVEIVTSYLDGALPVPERERFELHFDACPHCARYLAQFRETIELTGQLTVDDVDALRPDARDDLFAAFRSYQAD
jgi:anti-sigma factor RsiW